jgi:hypothetical protein
LVSIARLEVIVRRLVQQRRAVDLGRMAP